MSNVLKLSLQETIRSLHQKGWGQRRISRELGVHRKTVRLYLEAGPKCTTDSTAGSRAVAGPKCTSISTTGFEGGDGDRHGGGVVREAKSGRQSVCEPFRAFVECIRPPSPIYPDPLWCVVFGNANSR